MKKSPSYPPLIVGVGASAGGLEAIRELLASIGEQPPVAIVFVQHLDPHAKSLLPQLLADSTPMSVVEVTARIEVKNSTVYLCPPNRRLTLTSGFLSADEFKEDRQQSSDIDHFFHSIATDQGERGIGVILSGAGSDGTLGLKAISDRGGLTFAQSAESAKYDSMPRSAATTGVADHVLPPDEIAAELLEYAKHLAQVTESSSHTRIDKQIEEAIPAIAENLLRVTNHNFQHYKTSTLGRRIARRMQVLKYLSAAEYLSHLEQHEDESRALFRELLIGVTAFFRDSEAFETLSELVLPKLFANRTQDDCVRIWVAGCASGEEAYSMAMLCLEYLDSVDNPPQIQIFATDIDERALTVARAGTYPVGIEDQLSKERLTRFFVKRGKRYHVTKELRERVLFSAHNLISDPPFSRQDLISCRNLLIYLGSHLQNKLIPLFHYSLRPSGYLFLGPSENISSHGELFRTLDARYRISQRKGTAVGPVSSLTLRNGGLTPLRLSDTQPDNVVDLTNLRQRIMLDEFTPKSVVIDESGQVLNAAANLEKFLSIGDGDFHNNIIKMAQPGLRIGLRASISEAVKVRRKVQHENLSIRDGDNVQRVMLTVQPMPSLGDDEGLFLVVFHCVGLPINRAELAKEQRQTIQQDNFDSDEPKVLSSSATADSVIAQMESELETTRRDLERSMQDMEAANEELKSSNEELLSMNEELQSTNEELETSKEEIRRGSDAVARINADLENLLRSTQIATVFLDEELRIRSFTPAINQIYSLINTDVGRHLQNFVSEIDGMPPLPDPKLLVAETPIEHMVVSHSGKSFIRRVLPYLSHRGESEGIVITFTEISELRRSQEAFQLLVDASSQIVWVTNADGSIAEDSPSWRAFTGQSYEGWMGSHWVEMVHPDDRDGIIEAWSFAVRDGTTLSHEYRLKHHSGQYVWMQVRAVAQRNRDNSIDRWIGMNTDISERKLREIEALDREAHLRRVIDNTLNFIGVLDTDGTLLEVNAAAIKVGGVTREEVLGKKLWDCYWWDFDDASKASLQEAIKLAAAGELVRYDVSVRIAGDSRLTIDFMLAPVFNDDGAVAFLIPSGFDISDRKAMETTLRESEKLVRTIAENSTQAMVMIDDRGYVTYCNQACLDMTGFDAEEIRSKPLHDLIHHTRPDGSHYPMSECPLDRALPEDYTVRAHTDLFYRKDGSSFPALCAASPIFRDGVPVSTVIEIRDVTEQKRWEQEITNREAHLRRVINNQLGLVGLIDRNGTLLDVDDRSMQIAGVTREDVIGKHFAECAWWTYDPAVSQMMRESMERGFKGEVLRFDIPLYGAGLGSPDKRLMIHFMLAPVFDNAGVVEYLIPSGVDISERHAAELALHESERLLRLAADAAGFGTYHADLTTNKVTWSPEMKRLVGLPDDADESLPAGQIPDFVHLDDRELVADEMARALAATQTQDHMFTHRVIRPDGEVRWVKLQGRTIVPADAKESKPVQIVGTIVDVTDQKQFELKLEDARIAAEAANESKSTFLANMSHEIRTPMTAIMGYADLVGEKVNDEETRAYVHTIRHNGNFLLDIINDILDLSKIEAGKFDISQVRFSPHRLVEDVRSIMEVRATEQGIKLDVSYDTKIPSEIESDPKRLKQVLINLMGNAIKFTPQGEVQIHVSLTSENKLRFDITDSGIGMSQLQQTKLFQPFSQGDGNVNREFGGTGLGLAISKRLTEMLGGEITFASTLGKGSTFSVTVATGVDENVPLIHANSLMMDTTTQHNTAPLKLNCHVLIVDDRRDIRFLSKALLRKAGAETSEAEDGEVAIQMVQQQIKIGNMYDLILLDMQMPRLDGYATAKYLRGLGFTGPIIALTADAMQGDMSRCIEAGCNDYLSKPIDVQTLIEMVFRFTSQTS